MSSSSEELSEGDKSKSKKIALDIYSSENAQSFLESYIERYGRTVATLVLSRVKLSPSNSANSLSDIVFKNHEAALFQTAGEFPLRELDVQFEGSPFSSQNLAIAVRQTVSTLRRLKVSCDRLEGGRDNEGINQLVSALQEHPTLEFVEFRQCRRRDDHGTLLEVLRLLTTCPKLKRIVLSDVTVSSPTTEFVQALTALFRSPNLEDLKLLRFPFLQDEHIIAMFRTLKTNTALKVFCLASDNSASSEAAMQAIGETIQTNNTLESLTFYYNWNYSWSKRLLQPIAHALTINRTLKRLRLCRRSDDIALPPAINAFISAIRDNFVLEYLHGDTGLQWLHPDLQFYLKLNRVGRRHLIESETATREDWIRAIGDNLDDTPVVYYLLIKNPCLICNLIAPTMSTVKAGERLAKQQRKLDGV